jgi:hypothetical protein
VALNESDHIILDAGEIVWLDRHAMRNKSIVRTKGGA